jgi:hypothetical protein
VSRPVAMQQLPTREVTAPSQTLAKDLALEVSPIATAKFRENSLASGRTIYVTGYSFRRPDAAAVALAR